MDADDRGPDSRRSVSVDVRSLSRHQCLSQQEQKNRSERETTVLLSLEMWHISSSHRTRAEAAIIFLHIHKQMQLEGLTTGAARVAEIQKVGPTEVTRI